MTDRNSDAVINEINARVRNEWIEMMRANVGDEVGVDKYVCECSYGGCVSTMELTHEEYEAIRDDGTRFAIAVNHEDPETDGVVAEYERYTVVEKWLGEPRRMANDTNPRRAQLPPDVTARG